MVPIDHDSFTARGWSQLNVDFVESITRFLWALDIFHLHRTCRAWLRIAERIRTPHISFPQRRFNHGDFPLVPNVFHSLITRHIVELNHITIKSPDELELFAHHLPKLQTLNCSIICTEGSRPVFPPQLKELRVSFDLKPPFSLTLPAFTHWLNECFVGMSNLTALNSLELITEVSVHYDGRSVIQGLPINLQPLTRLAPSLTHLRLDLPLTNDRVMVLRQLVNLISLELNSQMCVTSQQLSQLLAEPIPFVLEHFLPSHEFSNEDVPLLKRLTHLTEFNSDFYQPDLHDLSFLSHMVQLREIYFGTGYVSYDPTYLAKSLAAIPTHSLISLHLNLDETPEFGDRHLALIFSHPMPVLKILLLYNCTSITSLAFLRQVSNTLEELALLHCYSFESDELVHLRYFPRLHSLNLTESFPSAHPLDASIQSRLKPNSPLFERTWYPALRTFIYAPNLRGVIPVD